MQGACVGLWPDSCGREDGSACLRGEGAAGPLSHIAEVTLSSVTGFLKTVTFYLQLSGPHTSPSTGSSSGRSEGTLTDSSPSGSSTWELFTGP